MADKGHTGEARQSPDSSSPKDVQEYYDSLLKLRDGFKNQVRALSANSLAVQRQAGEDLADVGSESFIRDTELSLMSEDDHKVRLIDAAIQRIEDGTFGVCSDCGEPIPDGRLKAIPYACLCVDCKSVHESMGQ